MNVQKWCVTHHISVFSVFSACDAEETEKTEVFVSFCGVFRHSAARAVARKSNGAMGVHGAGASDGIGGVTLDSNYIIPQKPYCNAIRCENANASG